MPRPEGFTWLRPDFLLQEGHFGDRLLQFLGGSSFHEPGQSVSRSMIAGGIADIGALARVLGAAMSRSPDPSLEFPEFLRAIDFIQRLAEFYPAAAEVLECANPPRAPSSPTSGNGATDGMTTVV